MEEEQQPDLVEQFFDFLSQLVMPEWEGLLALLPLLFVVLVVLFLVHTAWQWRRAGSRNRSRVPPPRAGTPPPGVHLPGPSRWPFVLPIGAAILLFSLVLPPRDETGQVTSPFNVPLLIIGLLITIVAVVGWLRDAMKEWRSTAVASEGVAGTLGPGTRPVGGIAAHAGGGAVMVDRPQRVEPAEPPPGVHMPGPSPWPFFAPLGIALIFFGLILSPALVLGGLVMSVIAAAGWLREASHEYRSTEAVGHAVPATRDPEKAWPRRLVTVYVTVAVLSVVLALLPMGLEWLGGLGPGDPDDPPAPAVPAVPEITARTVTSFDTDRLVVPCCRDFELVFHNEQEGVPHDVAIGDGPEMANVHFDGDVIDGPDTITYEVPALEEGDYYFLCTIHPNMNGTVEARPEP